METGRDAGRRHAHSGTCVCSPELPMMASICPLWTRRLRLLMAFCLLPFISHGNLNSESLSYQGIWAAVSTWESTRIHTYTAWTHTRTLKGVRAADSQKGLLSVSHLIVEVVNLQLIAPSAVGEVEAAVFLGGEQLCVLMLLKRRSQVKAHTRAKYEKETSNL